MKIENEVTGEIAEVKESYVGIRLHICSFDGITDFFAVDTKEKEITTRMNATTKILLQIEHTYEDYMTLIADLGLEIPESYKKHWIPAEEWDYYSIGQGGNVEGLGNYGELSSARFRKENYNAFPTRDLAEKGKNLSKLGRLVLLWQYANDCIFETDWLDGDTKKYFLKYDYIKEEVCHDYNVTIPSDTLYFEKREQVKTFIEMYETEIKKIMGVI